MCAPSSLCIIFHFNNFSARQHFQIWWKQFCFSRFWFFSLYLSDLIIWLQIKNRVYTTFLYFIFLRFSCNLILIYRSWEVVLCLNINFMFCFDVGWPSLCVLYVCSIPQLATRKTYPRNCRNRKFNLNIKRLINQPLHCVAWVRSNACSTQLDYYTN